MSYSPADAASYNTLGLDGSYGVSLKPALAALGNLVDKTALDFGTGTGRTARAMMDRGAKEVVAVDHDPNMLNAAANRKGVAYVLIDGPLPLADDSVDVALCANVFEEFSQLPDIVAAAREILRVLVPGGRFVAVVTNPDCVTYDYVDFRYIDVHNPHSGDPITCLVKGPDPVYVQDYYWTVDDYTGAMRTAGFTVESLAFPLAHGEPAGDADSDVQRWLDETRVAPDLIITCTKPRLDQTP